MSIATEIDEDDSNYQIFRECVFEAIVKKYTATSNTRKKTNSRRRQAHASTHTSASTDTSTYNGDPDPDPDPAELADFSDYLSTEIFPSLPSTLRTIDHTTLKTPSTATNTSLPHPTDPADSEVYSLPLTLTTLEHLTSSLPPSVHDTLQTYAMTSPPITDTTNFLSPILTSFISHATRSPPAPSSTRTTACELCERD